MRRLLLILLVASIAQLGAGATVPSERFGEATLGAALVEFTDTFDNLDNWTLFGDPLPVHVASIFSKNGIFDNRGNDFNNSGAISESVFDLSLGFLLESEVYLDFSDTGGCWAAASIGIANPAYQAWGGYDNYVYFSLDAQGRACGLSPDSLETHAYFFGGYQGESGWSTFGPTGSDPYTYRGDSYANGWHTLKIEVDDLGVPVFCIDTDTIYVGSVPIAGSVLSAAKPLWLGSRSFGDAGKAYHNSVHFSSGSSCVLPGVPVLVSPQTGAQGCSGYFPAVWRSVATATKYRIEVSLNPSFSVISLDEETGGPDTTSNLLSTIFVAEDCLQFYWRVLAYNACGWGNPSLNNSLIVCGVPGIPTRTNPVNNALDVIQPVVLQWDSLTSAAKYSFQVDNNSNFSSPEVNDSATDASGQLPNLAEGTKYYWRVRARNSCGWGNWPASGWAFTTESGCPRPGVPTRRTPGEGVVDVEQPVIFEWDSVSTALKYHIQVDDSVDFNTPEIDDSTLIVTGMSDDSALAGETQYYWRLRAYNSCGWGNWNADGWAFTTRTPCPLPAPPTMYLPAEDAEALILPLFLDWAVGPEHLYKLMVDDDSLFTTPVIDLQTTVSNYTATNLTNNRSYYWIVKTHNTCGWGNWSPKRKFTIGISTDVVEVNSSEVPSDFILSQNYPNPFNPVTTIEFFLPRRSEVTLEVFDILGRKVITLVPSLDLAAGFKRVTWDGLDEHERPMPSGIYFYRIRAENYTETRKMGLLR